MGEYLWWESWHNQNVRNLLARAGLQIVGPRLWQFQSNFLINIDFHLIITSGIKFKQLFPPPPGLTGNQPSLEATTAVSSSPRQSCSMPSAIEGALPPFSISESFISFTPFPLTQQKLGFGGTTSYLDFALSAKLWNKNHKSTQNMLPMFQIWVKICQVYMWQVWHMTTGEWWWKREMTGGWYHSWLAQVQQAKEAGFEPKKSFDQWQYHREVCLYEAETNFHVDIFLYRCKVST